MNVSTPLCRLVNLNPRQFSVSAAANRNTRGLQLVIPASHPGECSVMFTLPRALQPVPELGSISIALDTLSISEKSTVTFPPKLVNSCHHKFVQRNFFVSLSHTQACLCFCEDFTLTSIHFLLLCAA